MDYSKWNNIEISDDEDDKYLDIATSSVYQQKHEARIARMEKHKQEMESLKRKKTEYEVKLSEAKRIEISSENIQELAKIFNELKLEKEEMEKMEKKLEEEERKTPWNVDTISKPGFSKTVINTKSEVANNQLVTYSEEAVRMRQLEFFNCYHKEIKHYGKLKSIAESKTYLEKHPHLLSEFTVDFLGDWCIRLELEQQNTLVEHIARQCSNLFFILHFATLRNCHPITILDLFFARIQIGKVDFLEEIKKTFTEDVIQNATKFRIFY